MKKINIFCVFFVAVFCFLAFNNYVFLNASNKVELYIDKGNITLTDTTLSGYNSAGGSVTANTSDGCVIKQTNPNVATMNRVVVKEGATVDITLAGINIDVSSVTNGIAFSLGDKGHPGTGAEPAKTNVKLRLSDNTNNTLVSNGHGAGLQTNKSVKLEIFGPGSLNATGGSTAAGIGGGGHNLNNYNSSTWYSGGGTIIIWDGNITAKTTGTTAAGIGDADRNDDKPDVFTKVYILGGTVRASTAGDNTSDDKSFGDDIGASGNWGLNGGSVHPDPSTYSGGFATVYTDENGVVHTGGAVIYADTYIDQPGASDPGVFVKRENGVDVYHVYADTEVTENLRIPGTSEVVYHNGATLTAAEGGSIVFDKTPTELYIDKGSIVITNDTVSGYDKNGNLVTTFNRNGYMIKQTNPNVATANTVAIKEGTTVDIVLAGINIDATSLADGNPAFSVGEKMDEGTAHPGKGAAPASSHVKITLAENTVNSVKSSGHTAGLQTNESVKLEIFGPGTLNATATLVASGIGGGAQTNGVYDSAVWYSGGGTIIIWGGNINAMGTGNGAGIGDGDRNDDSPNAFSNVYIIDGVVRADTASATDGDAPDKSDDIGASGNWGLNGGTVNPSPDLYKGGFATVYTDENGVVHSGSPIIYADNYIDQPCNEDPGIFVRQENGIDVYHIYADTVIDEDLIIPSNAKIEYHDGATITTENGARVIVQTEVTELYIDKGNIVITDTTVSGYDRNGNLITKFNRDGYVIKQTNPNVATSNRIVIKEGTTVNITLAGVNVDTSSLGIGKPAISIGEKYSDLLAHPGSGDMPDKSEVRLTLAENTVNTFRSSVNASGVQTNESSILHIEGKGSLTAVGGDNGAGIGGGGSREGFASEIWYSNGGTIYIWDGNITAIGGSAAPGIGEGDRTDDVRTKTNIYILGGIVNAKNGLGTGASSDLGSPDDVGGSDNWGGVDQDKSEWAGVLDTEAVVDGVKYTGNPIIVANSYSGVDPADDPKPGIFVREEEGKVVYNVYSDTNLTQDIEIPAGAELKVHDGASFTVAEGVTLSNKGSIVNNGEIVNQGVINNQTSADVSSGVENNSGIVINGNEAFVGIGGTAGIPDGFSGTIYYQIMSNVSVDMTGGKSFNGKYYGSSGSEIGFVVEENKGLVVSSNDVVIVDDIENGESYFIMPNKPISLDVEIVDGILIDEVLSRYFKYVVSERFEQSLTEYIDNLDVVGSVSFSLLNELPNGLMLNGDRISGRFDYESADIVKSKVLAVASNGAKRVITLTFVSDDFLDIQAPRGMIDVEGASYSNGIWYTDKESVTIKIVATDNVSEPDDIKMILSSKQLDMAEIADENRWELYKESKVWDLVNTSATNSKNYVYLYLKDEAGNVSPVSVSMSLNFSVTYHGGSNATNVPLSKSSKVGTLFGVAIQEPKVEGKYFLGWSESEGGSVQWLPDEIIPAKYNIADKHLYAVYGNQAPILADKVKVGDYVEYPISYSNLSIENLDGGVDTSDYNGWMVVDWEGDSVVLVSVGTPLKYKFDGNSSESVVGLNTGILNSVKFEEIGFEEATLGGTFGVVSDITEEVRTFSKSDIDNLLSVPSVDRDNISSYGSVFANGTSYYLSTENGDGSGLWSVDAGGVVHENLSNDLTLKSLGIRVVVMLKPSIRTIGRNVSGSFVLVK